MAGLDFGDFHSSDIDLFGDAYEFLISNYAANAGKSGGEFFTPQQVSKLIAQLAMHGQTSINNNLLTDEHIAEILKVFERGCFKTT
ncbi:N-6 DNA methylase [Endozoicomonas acroporae]|uniref:N-6 DNA methylase n=1 Tax=Endozoicomonas acroporae TaxID=1701104 RepID=UPI003F8937D8